MAGNDHRVRVTNMLIRKALVELLKQKPIHNISIKELCEASGINRGTFYAHYTDIYDLREKMEEEMLAGFEEALEPLLSLSEENLTPLKITAEIFQCLKNNADACAVILGPYGDRAFAARLIDLGRKQYVASYQRLLASATQEQLEYCYAFVSSGCIGVLERWLAGGMRADTQQLAALVEQIMIHGIESLREMTVSTDKLN